MSAAQQTKSKGPVVRVSTVLIGVCIIAAVMIGPLVLVWKQSYINQASIRLESKADTLNALNREIASLKLKCSNLSSTARIERLAKSYGLEHPSPSQIEVVGVTRPRVFSEFGIGKIFDRVKNSLLGESGQ